MRRRWQVALPILGLLLFSAVTLHSVRYNRLNFRPHYRYFWWGAGRLDRTPGQRSASVDLTPVPCDDGNVGECYEWEPEHIWIEPGLVERILILTALPAFALGAGIVSVLSRFGINQLATFFGSVPVLISLWFYGIGFLIDRMRSRRSIKARN